LRTESGKHSYSQSLQKISKDKSNQGGKTSTIKTKTLKKEIEEDTRRWKDLAC
jgi:hypothetical protein